MNGEEAWVDEREREREREGVVQTKR